MSKPIEISVKIYHNTESFILLNWEEVHLDGSMAVNVFASLTMATLIFTLWKQRRVKNYQQLYVGKFFDYYNFSFPITWKIIKCVWYCFLFSFTRCHRKLVTCLHPALSISSETVSQGPSLARLFQGYCDHYSRNPL